MRARRGLPLRARDLFGHVLLTMFIALPIATASVLLRAEPSPEPPAPVEAIDGEHAVMLATRVLAARPDDTRAMADLALAYLQRVRETADPTYYTKADELAVRALARDGGDPLVLVAAASVANGKHDFATALERASAARARAPKAPIVYAALVDALVELGRYDEAVAAAQTMVDLRPDLASYSRVSYLRELHGDVPGAIDAMRRAVAAGAPLGEATAWSDVQLGNLYLAENDLAAAEGAYEEAIERVDAYAHAIAGLARVRVARGDLAGAAAFYERVVRVLPLPEHVAALGDVYAASGDARRAGEQYALVEATQRLFAASGVRTDVDLALFDLDHGRDAARALAVARSEYALRPSAYVAGILAWAELASGDADAAVRHAAESLRLGWRDPQVLRRSRAIADGAGDLAGAAALRARVAELSAP